MSDSTRREKLATLLGNAQLPALPHSAVQLLRLARDPKIGPLEFAVPIESDPGLACQVLRFVNSSYFGFKNQISSVKVAISMVGIRTVHNFLLWSALFSLLPNPKCGPFDMRRLWQDSLRRGIFARRLAQRWKLPDVEDLFTVALLQDMAVPVLAKELPIEYAALFAARDGGLRRLSDLEREKWGWTHGEAGSQLAKQWGLPEALANRFEHHTELPTEGAPSPEGLVIALSSMLPSNCDDCWHERDAFLAALIQATGEPNCVEELFTQVDEEFDEFAPILRISQPTRPLRDALQTEPATVA